MARRRLPAAISIRCLNMSPVTTPSAIFLARVTIPVTLDANAPPTTRPVRDMATRVSADNSARPFIVMPGKWSGRALTLTSLVQP